MASSGSRRHALGAHLRRGGVVRWLVVVAAIVGIAGIVVVALAAYRHAHEDDRVRAASDRLSTPAGWKLVDVTKESGSPFLCIVSCPHAQVTKVYRTELEPVEACDVIKNHVAREIARPQTPDGAFCGWSAPLEDVGEKADVTASADTAAQVRQLPSHFWPRGSAPTDDATYVFVTFSGGQT